MDDRCEGNLKSCGRLKQEVNNEQTSLSSFNILFSPFRQYMESATVKETDLFAKQNVRGSAYGSNP